MDEKRIVSLQICEQPLDAHAMFDAMFDACPLHMQHCVTRLEKSVS